MAQVNVGEDCIHPPGSKYADSATHGHLFRFTSFYIPPTVVVWDIGNLALSGFGSCGPPPPSVPGSQATVDLSGMLDYDLERYCVENCDSPASATHIQDVIQGTMVITFDHQEGATRFFHTAVQLMPPDATNGFFGSGSGTMTIEDIGDGISRVSGGFNAALMFCEDFGMGLDCHDDEGPAALFTLGWSTLTDVPFGPASESLSLAPAVPNPVHSRAHIRFTLPSQGVVTLNVYDLAGRQVASLFDGRALTAGVHEADIDTRGWRPGCYFYRLAVGAEIRTHSMVIVR
jgi:hypothetical protein